jgi:hypothetical protein
MHHGIKAPGNQVGAQDRSEFLGIRILSEWRLGSLVPGRRVPAAS